MWILNDCWGRVCHWNGSVRKLEFSPMNSSYRDAEAGMTLLALQPFWSLIWPRSSDCQRHSSLLDCLAPSIANKKTPCALRSSGFPEFLGAPQEVGLKKRSARLGSTSLVARDSSGGGHAWGGREAEDAAAACLGGHLCYDGAWTSLRRSRPRQLLSCSFFTSRAGATCAVLSQRYPAPCGSTQLHFILSAAPGPIAPNREQKKVTRCDRNQYKR